MSKVSELGAPPPRSQRRSAHAHTLQTAGPDGGAAPHRDRKRSAPPASHYSDSVRPPSRRDSALSRERAAAGPVAAAAAHSRKLQPATTGGYVNPNYVGSVTSVARGTLVVDMQQSGVIREQYCSCARWSRLERLLLTVVAVMAGVVVGLVVVVTSLALADPAAVHLPGLARRAASQ